MTPYILPPSIPSVTRPASTLRLSVIVGLATLFTACSSVGAPPPQVDVLPTTPPDLAAPAANAAAARPSGGLYRAASYRPNFEDRRARMVGDVVTIQIVENVTASQKSSSTADRNSSLDSSISAFPFLSKTLTGKATLGAKNATTFAGKGGTESANTFSGAITTTVVEVLPNGHMIVTGEKQIGVNQNVDVMRFSGTVDPRALQPGSIVNSNQVANVRIDSKGRGVQNDAQTIGWLSRFFLTLSPF